MAIPVIPEYKVDTGKIDNSVGESPSMPRSEIVLDPKNGCGRGLHSGSLSYATDWVGSGVML